jgi:uncharacterized protein YyaL (SSP411 family)
VSAGVEQREIQRQLPEIRQKLLAQRATRQPPRDTKQLAGWNGLLLWALAEASATLRDPRYEKAAAGVAAFLRTLWDGERLYRARDGMRVLGESSLEDYAFVAAGMRTWSGVTGEAGDRALARDIAASAWRDYFVAARGWRMDATARLPDMPLDRAMPDGALPAPSGVMIQVSDDLLPAAPGGRRADAKALSGSTVSEAPFWHATHAIALLNADVPRPVVRP